MSELINIQENENRIPIAILVGLNTPEDRSPAQIIDGTKGGFTKSSFDHMMDEMINLIEACDMEVACSLIQFLPHPDNATYIGKGKAEELSGLVKEYKADYVVAADNLSPSQMKNLQDIVGAPVWDRTNLILEIFSRRAKTREAKLQVESAYLQYMLPRLSGMWQHLGRQGGGSGSRSNKGVGETQLELDRRQINHRLAELSKELDTISRTRQVQREGRKRGNIPSVALVGYTNAGKSSLMNALLTQNESTDEKKVFEKNMLFATLDTSIRHIYQDNNQDFLLSDTVGFIENLPHGLVKAFRSTLEEVKYADLLLIVTDSSDPFAKQHRAVTENTLKDLEAGDIPRIYVMNKSDLLPKDVPHRIVANDNTIYISTRTGEGIGELLNKITGVIYRGNVEVTFMIPYNAGEIQNRLHLYAEIKQEEYLAEGVKIKAVVSDKMSGELERYKLS